MPIKPSGGDCQSQDAPQDPNELNSLQPRERTQGEQEIGQGRRQKRNVIYERVTSNLRKQKESEPVDSLIAALYGLAEHWEYGNLHDQLIRDRIVVGIRDAHLSEKLQLDSSQTLSKALQQARKAEAIKQQQLLLRGGGQGTCGGA